MRHPNLSVLGAVLLAAIVGPQARAQDAVKIGLVTTLSGPPGYLGEDMRDGFQLAIDEGEGSLGGAPIKLIVEDDGLNPGNAKQIVDRLIERDDVPIITGIIFSNVMAAVAPAALAQDRFVISSNAAPSLFAGEKCDENYFVVSWQNDAMHEVAAIAANEAGYGKAVVMVPNYQAGKDAVAGFKRFYEGEIVEEIYTQLDQTDYAAEIARIRAAKPNVLFYFLPGGLGINFLKQYAQAGMTEEIPAIVPMVSMEARILGGVGDAADGILATSFWNWDIENDANRAFVDAYRDAYGREPTPWAAQGYDTARLIGSALQTTGGVVLDDPAAFRAALRKADFASVRGDFAFGANNHPIQDWYLLEVEPADGGARRLVTRETIASDHGDAYAEACELPQ